MLGCFADKLWRKYRSGVDRDFIGTGIEQVTNIVDRAHTTTHSQRDKDLAGHALNCLQHGVAPFYGGRNIQKGQLISTLLAVTAGNFYRIASIANILKFYAFYHAAIFNIKARNDTFRERHAALHRVN